MRKITNKACGFAVAMGLIVVSGCASTTPPEEGQLVADDSNRVVCRDDINTGSRLAKKTCRTQAEWDELAAASAELGRNLERDTSPGSLSSGTRQ